MILSTHFINWVCPNCTVTTRKPFSLGAQEYHLCKGMKMLAIPLVEEGKKVKITSNEREDYIGSEDVQLDGDGRPVMNTIVERDDGTDCTVYAPSASVERR